MSRNNDDKYNDWRPLINRAFLFIKEVFLSKEIENMACSPVSALMPLAKMAIGAKGDSQRELLEAIGISRKSKVSIVFFV